MSDDKTSERQETQETADEANPTKAELQRRMERTRDSISQTVEEIKETMTEQYETVKETVNGVLDYREQFQKDPLVWSVGALSAGFALGYTLGYAHKNAKATGRKHSELATFAESLVDELSVVGKSLVMPTLNSKIKELFGFDFADLLEEMGQARQSGDSQTETQPERSRKALPKRGAKKSPQKGTRKSTQRSAAPQKSVKKKRASKRGAQ